MGLPVASSVQLLRRRRLLPGIVITTERIQTLLNSGIRKHSHREPDNESELNGASNLLIQFEGAKNLSHAIN